MKIIRISSTWCTSCIVSFKDYKKIKEEYPDIDYIEYDYDEDEEIKKYDIGNILPVIIIEKDNKEVKRLIGEKKFSEIKKEIEELR